MASRRLLFAVALLCVATLGCVAVIGVNGDGATGTSGSAAALIAGLASLRVSAQLQQGSSPFPPTMQVLLDNDLRTSLSNSSFSCSVAVSQDAPLIAVIFEVEFLDPQSSMSISLSSPDLPQDPSITMLISMAASSVQHTNPVPPSQRHTYAFYLMLLTPILLGIHPSSDVVPITLQFTLSVASTVDPSVHREYGVGVVSLIQPSPMFQPTRVFSIESNSPQQSLQVLPSFNSSWVSNITFSNRTAPSLVVSRDAFLLTDTNTSVVDRGVSVWQQTFDVFLSNVVSGPTLATATSTSSNNSSVRVRFNVTTQLRVPLPSLWLPLLPLQADMASAAGQLLQVTGTTSRCASDVGDATNSSTLRMGGNVSPTLQWDSDFISAGLQASPDDNPTTVLLQTNPMPLEIEINLPAGNRTFNILRCMAFTFNLTNLTHTQAYRLEWRAQVHMADIDQRVSSSSTTQQQGASSTGTSNVATTTTTASSDGLNGAGNETDGGSTTLGVFSGLAVFALVGYRIWLEYKERRGNQLLRSVEQPQAGAQL